MKEKKIILTKKANNFNNIEDDIVDVVENVVSASFNLMVEGKLKYN
jgi:hypothetical protein